MYNFVEQAGKFHDRILTIIDVLQQKDSLLHQSMSLLDGGPTLQTLFGFASEEEVQAGVRNSKEYRK